MKHLQKAPRKPLFNKEQGEVFVSMVDGDLHKEIANKIFVDGMTNEEVAEEIGYSKRQMERIRISLMKTVLKKLVEKQIPKKPIDGCYPWCICPACGGSVYLENMKEHILNNETTYCEHCGQALLWESEVDTE